MIEVQNIYKSFEGNEVVKNVSFSVAEGKTLVLLGTSGSGKTTTLKMLNRLIEPDKGKIWIQGKDISAQNPDILRRQIGYVIQQFGLFPHFTIEENIATVPKLLGWEKNKIKLRTYELLELLDLNPTDFLQRFPHQLSGGQRQRIGIARALAAHPPVLLLDEPLGALDPITRLQIQKEIKKILKISSQSTVFVTHDVGEAFELGDEIALMHAGEIQQIGVAKEFIFAPTNGFSSNFFAPKKLELGLKISTLADLTFSNTENISTENRQILEFDADTSQWDFLQKTKELSQENILIAVNNLSDNAKYLIELKEILQKIFSPSN